MTHGALAVRSVASLGNLAMTWYTYDQLEQGASPAQLGFYSGMLGFLASATGAGTLVLLLVAVFTDRPREAS